MWEMLDRAGGPLLAPSINPERSIHFQSGGAPCLPWVGKRGTRLEEQNPSSVRLGICGHGQDPHLENREMWATPRDRLTKSRSGPPAIL
jgi:hypothetical protein